MPVSLFPLGIFYHSQYSWELPIRVTWPGLPALEIHVTLKLAHREEPSDGPGKGASWKQHPQLRGCGVFCCLLSQEQFYHLPGRSAA